MSNPTTSFRLDLGSLEEEFARTLESIADEDVKDELPPDPNLPREYRHLVMAQAFVEHDVAADMKKSMLLAKRLERDEQRKEKNRKLNLVQDAQKAMLEQIHEVFEGYFDRGSIKDLLKQHDHNPDLVIDELGKASMVKTRKEIGIDPIQPAKMVYAPSNPFVFNNTPKKSNSSPDLTTEVSEQDAIKIANDYARRLNHDSKHHYERASHYGPRDLRCGALTAIARLEREKARDHEDEADAIRAAKINDSLDLHNMPVERALRFTNAVIESIRKRCPRQSKLEVITGRGANNAKGKAVIKTAIIQWLKEMKIAYELPTYNAGVVIVNLRSIQ